MRSSRLLHIPLALVVALAVGAGVLWWWAALRLALAPEESGPVEGAVVVGGWTLGLLPVHCVRGPLRGRRGAAPGRGAGDGGDGGDPGPAGEAGRAVTRASTLHRSGEGSGPS